MSSTETKPAHLAPSRFQIRPATLEDVPSMTDVWFNSFNSPFWKYFVPDGPANREFWDLTWKKGLQNPSDRTFVAEDTEENNRIVAFSRWTLPQADGDLNREASWHENSESGDWDLELLEAFFGGMAANRAEIMGKRPHWMLELLGTHNLYSRHGIGARLMKWGTDQADASGLETYLDGSAAGQAYYEKRHGFRSVKKIVVPEREAYGSYNYVSMVRAPQQCQGGGSGKV